VLNDVTVGAYDVVFQPGPNYSTRREEAREGMNTFMQAAPQAAALVLDLFAEAQDWPNAEKIGKRLESLLPPDVRTREAAERGEQGAPAADNPAQAVAAQAQAIKLQVEHERAQADIAEAQARAQIARDNARKAAIEVQMKEIALAKSLAPRPLRRSLGRGDPSAAGGEGDAPRAMPNRRE
jgi:hypothetical protein